MSLSLLLDRLVDFERRACQVYKALGQRSYFPAAVQRFWMRMAEDKQHHAAILERSLASLTLVDSPSSASENALAILEAKVGAAEAAARHTELSCDEALRLTIMLEDSELSSVDEVWFQGLRPAEGSLLQTLLPDEEDHIRRVVEAVQAFSTDQALHHQAATLGAAHERQQRAYTPEPETN